MWYSRVIINIFDKRNSTEAEPAKKDWKKMWEIKIGRTLDRTDILHMMIRNFEDKQKPPDKEEDKNLD